MLVLSRKVNERLIIGDNIVVTITKIAGDRVRVGIEAPRDVSVQRQEIIGRKPKPGMRELELVDCG
jgi:carbon storage regulator